MGKFGFTKGWRHLRMKDIKSAQEDLYKVFGINNRNTFRLHRNGDIEPTVSEKEGVEAVFLKYDVRKGDVWGD